MLDSEVSGQDNDGRISSTCSGRAARSADVGRYRATAHVDNSA